MAAEKTMIVKLKKAHTHQGKDFKPGDEITVRKSQADRLIKNGTAGEVIKKEYKGGE